MRIEKKILLKILILGLLLLSFLGAPTTVNAAIYGSGGEQYLLDQITKSKWSDADHYYYNGIFYYWSYSNQANRTTHYEYGLGRWDDQTPAQIQDDLYNPEVVQGRAYLGGTTGEFGWWTTGTVWTGEPVLYTSTGVPGNSKVRYTKQARTSYKRAKTTPVSSGLGGYGSVVATGSGHSLWVRPNTYAIIRIDSYQNPNGLSTLPLDDYPIQNHLMLTSAEGVDARAGYSRDGAFSYWGTNYQVGIVNSWHSVSGNVLHTAYGVMGYYDGKTYAIHSHVYSANGKAHGYVNTGYTLSIDGTAPNAPAINVSPSGWTNQNVTVTLTDGYDAGVGVSRTEYALNDGAWTKYTGPLTFSATTKITARTIDHLENVSSVSTAWAAIDKVAPYPYSSAIHGAHYVSGSNYWFKGGSNYQVDSYGYDATSQLLRSYIRMYDGITDIRAEHAWEHGDGHINPWVRGDWSTSLDATARLVNDGYHRGLRWYGTLTGHERDYAVQHAFYDSAWNLYDYSTIAYIRVDNTAPSGSYSQWSRDWGGNVSTTFTPSDSRSGVSAWWYTVYKNGVVIEQSSVTGATPKTFTFTDDAVYNIQTHVYDNVGNNAYHHSGEFKVDKVKPTLVNASLTGYRYSNDVWRWYKPTDLITANQSMTDERSGLMNIYAQITDDGAFQKRIGIHSGGGTPWVDNMGGTASTTFSEYNATLISSSGNQRNVRYTFKIPYDGKYSYFAQTLDYAWNWAGPTEHQGLGTGVGIGIDGTKPTTTIGASTTSWTKNPVTIKVTGSDSGSGLKSIEMIGNNNYAGMNLLRSADTTTEYTYGYEYLRTPWDLAPIINKHGLVPYTLTFEMKSPIAGKMQAYMQNGSGSKYYFYSNFDVETYWKQFSITFTPGINDASVIESYLAFYGTYGTGVNPTVRKVKLELGTEATAFSIAPEDVPMVSGEKNFTVTKSGTYTFRVEDNVGNYEDRTIVINNIDLTPPTSVVTQNPNSWTNNPVEITVTGSDTQSGVANIEMLTTSQSVGNNYAVNGPLDYYSAGQPWNTALNGTLVPQSGWSPGYNGGVSAPSVGYHAHLNTSIFGYPVMRFVNKNSAYGYRNRWLGFAQQFNVNSPLWTKVRTSSHITVSYDVYSDKPGGQIAAGMYRYIAGTTSQDFYHLDSQYTTSANQWERKSFTVPIDGQWDRNKAFSLYIYGSYEDNEATKYVKNIKVEVGNSSTPYTISPEDVKMSGGKKVFSVTSNGTYNFRIIDGVGNSSTNSITISNIDMISPTGIITGNPTIWTNQDVPLTFTGSDLGGSSVKRVRMVGRSWVNGNKVTEYVSVNGIYTFEVEDNAGNVTSYSTTVNRIDKTIPNGVISPSVTNWTNGNVILSLSTSDAGGSGYHRTILPNGASTSSPTPSFTATTNGLYTFTVYDLAGNARSISYNVWNIDKINPMVSASPSNCDWVDDKITVSLNFTDSLSGVATRQYSWSLSPSSPAAWTNYTVPITQSSQGIWYLHYRVVDVAGNQVIGVFGEYKVKRETGLRLTNLRVTPQVAVLKGNDTSAIRNMSVTFTISNLLFPNPGKPINPVVTIKYGTDAVNTTLWTNTVQMPSNGSTTKTVKLNNVILTPGKRIIVEVNGAVSGYLRFDEYHYSGIDPYYDNKQSVSITVVKPTANVCTLFLNDDSSRTYNSWTERWQKTTQTAVIAPPYFNVTSRTTQTEVVNYNETYRISSLKFRSKYTTDNRTLLMSNPSYTGHIDTEGWQTIKRPEELVSANQIEDNIAKIKAGYGFELIVQTTYNTNRYIIPTGYVESFADYVTSPTFGNGYANYTVVSPSVTPVESPDILYFNLYDINGVNQYCQEIPVVNTQGSWYSRTKTFERSEAANDRIWTEFHTLPAVYEANIKTPNGSNIQDKFMGYEQEAPVDMSNKSYLHDTFRFKLQILGQDDIKSHYGN